MTVHSSKIYFCLGLTVIFVATSSAGKSITIKTEDDDRIARGRNATIDQIPYIVQIKYGNWQDFLCGGTIVSERHVISAAHCFKGFKYYDLQILANSTHLEYDEGQIYREVEALYIHVEYNPVTVENDVAVLKLYEPLPFGQGVKKIEMCTKNWRGKEKIIVAGWGYPSETVKILSNQLQMVKMDTISPRRCNRDYYGSPKIICGIMKRGNGPCGGDSGGPAIYNGTVCGIVSFGICDRKGSIEGFTSIAEVREFIEDAMKK